MPTAGWSWVDGTNASNLNCGSVGCGLWISIQPINGPFNTQYTAAFLDSGGIWSSSNDTPNSPSYTCEIEVCGPGQYLGPSFATGCLQCPPGSYSVGGAVGGCTLCPSGTFGNSTGLTSPACSGLCQAGRFGSGPGLTSSLCTGLCDAGRFGSLPGFDTSTCTAVCPAGYFCPPGTANDTENVGGF